jgi:osmotically-inducible protein OsmY
MVTTTLRSDAAIQSDVLQELKWDQRVDETDVGVQVKDGIVTLVGTIDSYAKKQAACDAAHRVTGVLDVANDLEVRVSSLWTKSDAEIAQAVRNALVWDTFVSDEKIKSTVDKGWVTLEGQVDNVYQRESAERVVKHLNGVRGVTDRIVVKPKSVEPAQIRSSIQGALQRQSEREAKGIDIGVNDGVVTLSGKVRSWSEKNAVENAALFAPGVRRIDNQLIVDSFS